MLHALRHDIAADRSGSTEHDQDGNQLVTAKAKKDGQWEKNGRLEKKLNKRTDKRWLDFGQRFFALKAGS